MSSVCPALLPSAARCRIPTGCPSEGPCSCPDHKLLGCSLTALHCTLTAIMQPFHTYPHLTPHSPGSQPCFGVLVLQLCPAPKLGWLHQHPTTSWQPADGLGREGAEDFTGGWSEEGTQPTLKCQTALLISREWEAPAGLQREPLG